MIRALLLLAAVACLAVSPARAAGTDLVLVANRSSPVAGQLLVIEARRLFLGLPLRVGGQLLKPVRNTSDVQTTAMFMQRVMFMSIEKYERQIQTRISRTGGSSPPAYASLVELIGALQRDSLAVTYMQRSQALSTAGLRIIGEP